VVNLKTARAKRRQMARQASDSPGAKKRIREALGRPERTEGVRKIAARFGVSPDTVQRISRPFVHASASV
jgi:hypothetical protein